MTAASTTMTLVAEYGDFRLFHRPEKSSDEWANLKLILGCPKYAAKKRNWWLAWNGERLARNRDAATLLEHRPEIHEWVIETLKAWRP